VSEHKFADAAALEVQTEPEEVGIGFDEALFEIPRPDLNGIRMTLPGPSTVWLIDRGYKRGIPNPETYNNLFRDWNGIVVSIDVNEIPSGPNITNGAILATRPGPGTVYLIDNGVKRGILNPAVMDKYHFAWNRIYRVPQIVLDSIPDGDIIT
jgi:hypothetical protein